MQPPEVFCREGVLKNCAEFTGKHLCRNLLFLKSCRSETPEKWGWRTPLVPASTSVETQWLKYQSDIEQCPDEKRFCVKENLKIKRIQFALKWTILKRKSSEVPGALGQMGGLLNWILLQLSPFVHYLSISKFLTPKHVISITQKHNLFKKVVPLKAPFAKELYRK